LIPFRVIRELNLKCFIILLTLTVILLLVFSKTVYSENLYFGTTIDQKKESGYHYLSKDLQALQDDDFLNPGIFSIDLGRELWQKKDGEKGFSCASCHQDAAESMTGIAAGYPKIDTNKGKLVNLELMINNMRAEHMTAKPYLYESEEMLALTAYLTDQSRGYPLQVKTNGPAKVFFEKGREFYFQRRGQLDLSCNQCHDDLAGQKLRGDTISQGQVEGFPIYRLMWRSSASRHRMFAWCNSALRAEPFQLGSEEYLNLELYLAWRGKGLLIGAPGVRI
jgi:sulfur-oxidizing protein SoxA